MQENSINRHITYENLYKKREGIWMGVKNTLFTALAAGIIFLSGMVILGKNTLLKKDTLKKAYVPIKTEQIVHKEEDRKVEKLHNKKVEQKLQEDSALVLLQMVNKLIQEKASGKVNYTINRMMRNHGGIRLAMGQGEEGKLLVYGDKQLHRIREPSVGVIEGQFKVQDSDKGG